ncbi:sn-glycerol-3-phosphate ABC transporter ATP-binding protein UgpC [Rubellimicrobium rubrum]|uniref:sn-glycerol-3-phosphate ABC transporter ATP-binding protein UgpC n=1 Tax=Rubellimicrobium rubrum TaxID=2585369 RepID=A0A5C4MSY6_9RHOB|nr:sn-glycerol-3-phosphate ABC transporter ATP-binding protein UgpC [Rubellimicrobium rubrum]TNC46922.1 sn-glycerol-3-phosphate ABC transporter ATP-binding protein UgpC [Rubellimicrobium rubrum]
MAEISLRQVRKSFGSSEVIKGVDIDIADGEFCVFVGPSGCGKSTLLRMIAGLEDISSGELRIGGRVVNDLPPKERRIAMVFQSYAIFPHMTVRENVAFGLTIAGASKAEKETKVAEAARILQMEHLLDRTPAQLSGGQRQRVAIGRAIVRKPEVFLFDEPLSNLDAALRMDMRLEIGKLHQQLKATMIYVTHDQVEAMTLADKIVVLKGGEVMQVGSPMELYHNPANLFVAGFLGSPSMNFLDVEIRGVQGSRVLVANSALEPVEVMPKVGTYTPGGRARLGVRPQYLTPVIGDGSATPPNAGRLHGTVALTERLGAETVVETTLSDRSRVIAALARDEVYPIGAEVTLAFKPEEAHLFPV